MLEETSLQLMRTSSNDIRRGNMGTHRPNKEQVSSRNSKDGKEIGKGNHGQLTPDESDAKQMQFDPSLVTGQPLFSIFNSHYMHFANNEMFIAMSTFMLPPATEVEFNPI